MKKFLIIQAMIFLLVGMAGCGGSSASGNMPGAYNKSESANADTNTPGGATKRLIKAVIEGNCSEAYSLVGTDDQQIYGSSSEFCDIMGVGESSDRPSCSNPEVIIKDEDITGSRATVIYTIKCGSKESKSEEISLVKEQGGWKLSAF